ncbi:alpha/beta hydrolase [Breznakiella homolactica]|uniref:Alpha/beta hydrolase n=1 Tax=Breznakiella homolactica TaxID=2798577 RepID=A0A7T8B8X2_9SPIR|nr:alpha/beta hydrolase [Breznakiella homolactica]QQO09064.1 alpha/beta hydrolase [Breznakiella homolactica]
MELVERVFNFPDDYEGPVISTLISAQTPKKSESAVLYIHGYIDYFFQLHMAEVFLQAGYNFYALDLRKYGRSLLEHQHFNYCRDMKEYYPEIDQAIETIRSEGNSFIAMIGHSTGGLLASLYCAEDGQGGKNRIYVNQLILNSPFLEFNTPWFVRAVGIPLISSVSRLFPYAKMKNVLSPYYAVSVHKSMKGEWDYDLKLKPSEGVPLYLAWLRAVRLGQKRVKRGLKIAVPVLVMHSERSSWEKEWDDIIARSDAVLDVRHIKKYAPRLAHSVTLAEIPEGLHDLVLSREPVRNRVFSFMLDWISKKR